MSKQTEIVCPICKRDDFKTERGLKTHLRYCKEKTNIEERSNPQKTEEKTLKQEKQAEKLSPAQILAEVIRTAKQEYDAVLNSEVTVEDADLEKILAELGEDALRMILNAQTTVRADIIASFLKAKEENNPAFASELLKRSYRDRTEGKGYIYESNHYIIDTAKAVLDLGVLTEKEKRACFFKKISAVEASISPKAKLMQQIDELNAENQALLKKVAEGGLSAEENVLIARKLSETSIRIGKLEKSAEKASNEVSGKKNEAFAYISALKNVMKLAFFKFLRAAANAQNNSFYEDFFDLCIKRKVFVNTKKDPSTSEKKALDELQKSKYASYFNSSGDLLKKHAEIVK